MKRTHSLGNRPYNPETLALGFGYDARLSEGSVKPPVFLTSTFQFESAEEGEHYFKLAYGLVDPEEGEKTALIYSRLNNPNLQIFEERMAAWDETEVGATFSSGMAAISTVALAFLRPNDVVICATPVYGGTHYLLEKILPRFGVEAVFVPAGSDAPQLMTEAIERVGADRVRMLYLETPANPSNILTDIGGVAEITKTLNEGRADDRRVLTVVDNTFLGPLFQRPSKQGADLVIYSATKFIGGHSDLIAGLVTGSKATMAAVFESRTILGTMANPFTGWMLQRSLETLSVRMRRQAKSAKYLAKMLVEHPKVNLVNYPGLLEEGCQQHDIYMKQCSGPGSLISFEIKGGKEAAFRVLNHFEIARLAVSLGGTESLVEHPMFMTHADVEPEVLKTLGVTEGLIRISVGLEHLSDLELDITHALSFA